MKKTVYFAVPLLLVAVLAIILLRKNESQKNDVSPSAAISPSAGGSPVHPSASTVVSASRSKRAYILEERIGIPEGNALLAISKLKDAAEKGDPKASLAIYLKLWDCGLSQEQQAETDLDAYKRAQMNVQGLEKAIAERQENCAGVGNEMSRRGEWLARAAAAGLPEAQILYASDSRSIVGSETDMLRNPQKLQEYKSKAAGYLNTLASTGNVDAMVTLAGAHAGGILVEQSPIRSYAYYSAAELARPNTVPANLLSSLRSQLPPSQVASGDALAQQIYKNCCVN